MTSRAIDLIGRRAFIEISHNPLRCSKCVDVTSVRWIVQTNAVIDKNALQCSTGQVASNEPLSISIQNHLQFECKLPTIITTSIATPVTMFIAACVATYVGIQLKRAKERMRLKGELILALRNGNGDIKNAAFIIYNDSEPDDDRFVKDILYPGLEIRLKQTTKSGRGLVRFKARDIDPGAVLLDKTDKLIKNLSVIAVLLKEHSFQDNGSEVVLPDGRGKPGS
ncbi:hypothetical protein DPMN_173052 [Dreissena polymorpha]|uniref:Uncharacterized protein n=1 Tax=Dreissena polymorpha TaxID=45954 RepID=A0A9D4IFQ6_DREPO|nr:hypothetical protein DPMN_173052 [Dreissena polymorpha]